MGLKYLLARWVCNLEISPVVSIHVLTPTCELQPWGAISG